MEIVFNTRYNRSHSEPETIIGPSMTEPEECLSIPEILSRYIRSGIKVDASYQGDQEDQEGQAFEVSWMEFDPAQEPAPESVPEDPDKTPRETKEAQKVEE